MRAYALIMQAFPVKTRNSVRWIGLSTIPATRTLIHLRSS
jgi:hypothetical protein